MNQASRNISKRKNQKPTLLDQFEQFCRIVHQYLRWPIQVAAVICCFAFMDPTVALQASICVLSVGNASALAALIEKWKG